MYIIVNNTTRERFTHEGYYPGNFIDDLLNKGDDVIVISLYSNTIKIPQLKVINGINEWSNKEYSLCMDIIAPEALVNE